MARSLKEVYMTAKKNAFLTGQITFLFFHLPLLKRQMSRIALRHQSMTIARVMPITPSPIHLARINDISVRKKTVQKMDDHMVKLISPAERSPEERGNANGWTVAENRL